MKIVGYTVALIGGLFVCYLLLPLCVMDKVDGIPGTQEEPILCLPAYLSFSSFSSVLVTVAPLATVAVLFMAAAIIIGLIMTVPVAILVAVAAVLAAVAIGIGLIAAYLMTVPAAVAVVLAAVAIGIGLIAAYKFIKLRAEARAAAAYQSIKLRAEARAASKEKVRLRVSPRSEKVKAINLSK